MSEQCIACMCREDAFPADEACLAGIVFAWQHNANGAMANLCVKCMNSALAGYKATEHLVSEEHRRK